MFEINLQKIKFWLVIILIQIGSFVLGFYSNNYSGNSAINSKSLQTNYTTKTTEQPKVNTPQNSNNSETNKEECIIKGNISSKSKIYHIQGGSFYDRTDAEMCFQTEEEAETAGFTKSSR